MTQNVLVRTVMFLGVACALLDPQDADAFEQRIAPPACKVMPYSRAYHDPSGRALNGSGNAPGILQCPLQDNSNHWFGMIDYVTVYAEDNGRRDPPEFVKAKFCLTPYGATGIFCGAAATSPGRGWQEIPVTTTIWSTTPVPGGFPYVWVQLPYWAGGAGAPSALAGISVGYE